MRRVPMVKIDKAHNIATIEKPLFSGRFPNFPDTSSESFEKEFEEEEDYIIKRVQKYNKKLENNSVGPSQKSQTETPIRKRESIYTVNDEKEHKISIEISTSKSIVSSKRTISEHIVIYSE